MSNRFKRGWSRNVGLAVTLALLFGACGEASVSVAEPAADAAPADPTATPEPPPEPTATPEPPPEPTATPEPPPEPTATPDPTPTSEPEDLGAGSEGEGPLTDDELSALGFDDQFFADCQADVGVSFDYEPVAFEVFGNEADMRGTIDSSTPCVLLDLLLDYPEVDTIVMIEVLGSANDVANLIASRMVRDAGLVTVVVADGGGIYSGGTDFFAAGVERFVESGAQVGVHSWAVGEGGLEGGDLPRDDPAHDWYLDYYEEMGVPADFYWFTLDAAPAAGMHIMTEEELLRYEIATEILAP